jgi:hypothetical protein
MVDGCMLEDLSGTAGVAVMLKEEGGRGEWIYSIIKSR